MSPRPPRRPRSTGPTGEGGSTAEDAPRRPSGAAPHDPPHDARQEAPHDASARRSESHAEHAEHAEHSEQTADAAADAAVDDTVVPLTREVPLVAGRRGAAGAPPEQGRPADGEDAPKSRTSPASGPHEGPDGRAARGSDDPDDAARDGEEADLLAFPEPEVVVHRRRRRRGVLLVLAGLAALLVVVLVLVFSPLLTVKQVQVEGNDLLTDARAEELLQPALGRPMPQVGDGRVEELLDEEAVVADVVVQGELPDTLRVEITEHPPVAEVRRDGQVEYYTAEGEVIRSWPQDEAPGADEYATPEISSDAALDHRAVFESIVGVLGELPGAARESMESATADSVDSVRLRLDDGRTVVWGGEDRGEQKAEVLAALLASDAEEFTEVDTIDISDPEAPVTR